LTPDQERTVSTLGDYVATVRRWKWVILTVLILAPLVAVLVSRREPPVYEASAQVLIKRQNLALQLQGVNDPTAADATRTIQTQAQLARLPEVARRTVAAAGVREGASQLIGNSSVRTEDNNDILTLLVRDRDAAIASRLATAYAEQFTKYSNELDNAAISSTLRAVQTRITSLEEAGDKNSPLYTTLVNKAEELRTLEALQTSRTVVVREASGAGKIAPNPSRAGMLGAILGLVVGVGLAFLAEALDPRIRSEDKLRAALNLHLLGRLPRPPLRLRRRNRLVMMDAPGTPHAEAFRMMAANLDFVTLKSGVKTVMVTSALAREGKTTTVANLGIALARQGRKVILLDFDAQAPSLHEFFHITEGPGLSDLALGRAGLDDAFAQIEIADLGVKPNGAQASVPMDTRPSIGLEPIGVAAPMGPLTNVTTGSLKILRTGEPTLDVNAFLSSDMAPQVLNTIALQADLVLIDSPPILQSSSAITLATEVDAILVVSRLKTLKAPALHELARVLANGFRARQLGFAVTNSDMPRPSYHASSYDLADARSGVLSPLATIRDKQASER
jgi:Mrp family chromosome partitioning ATPase/capsular polysaccharide biosynthesis protein